MIRREARRYSERSDTARTSGAGCVPADSPPEAGVCIAGEGREGLEALHEVVEVRPARRHLGRVALPQNLPPGQGAVTRHQAEGARLDSSFTEPCRESAPHPNSPHHPQILRRVLWGGALPLRSQSCAVEAAHAVAHTISRS